MTDKEYIIREIEDTDRSELSLLINNNFYPYEPTVSAYFDSISDEEREISMNYFKEHTKQLKYSPCLIVVHRGTKKIVGIIMLKIDENPKLFPNSKEYDCSSDTSKFSPTSPKIAKEYLGCFLIKASERFKVFEEFKTAKKALEIKVICIHSEHRRKGLANILIQEAIKYARDNKIDVVYGLFTSPFSQKTAMKNGLRSYLDMDILSFNNLEGEPIFKGQNSHIVSAMAMEL